MKIIGCFLFFQTPHVIHRADEHPCYGTAATKSVHSQHRPVRVCVTVGRHRVQAGGPAGLLIGRPGRHPNETELVQHADSRPVRSSPHLCADLIGTSLAGRNSRLAEQQMGRVQMSTPLHCTIKAAFVYEPCSVSFFSELSTRAQECPLLPQFYLSEVKSV